MNAIDERLFKSTSTNRRRATASIAVRIQVGARQWRHWGRIRRCRCEAPPSPTAPTSQACALRITHTLTYRLQRGGGCWTSIRLGMKPRAPMFFSGLAWPFDLAFSPIPHGLHPFDRRQW